MDAGLSVRLLRHLNSAAIALPRRVSSIRMAVLMLGEQPMKQWVMVHLLAGVGPQRPALLWAALVRARFCELIGKRARVADAQSWFARGLLSLADALTGCPIADAVADLPLSQELRDLCSGERDPEDDLLRSLAELRDEDPAAASRRAVRHELLSVSAIRRGRRKC